MWLFALLFFLHLLLVTRKMTFCVYFDSTFGTILIPFLFVFSVEDAVVLFRRVVLSLGSQSADS